MPRSKANCASGHHEFQSDVCGAACLAILDVTIVQM
jgi:hypothetical protein